jgi:anti-anti-sigma factor
VEGKTDVDLDVLQSGTTCTLRVKGHLKGPDAIDQFDAAVQAAFASDHYHLILNLETMPIIDSSGIGAIVNALVQAKKLGGDVKLVNPSPFALKTFKMVHILNLFGVFENEEDALAACGS